MKKPFSRGWNILLRSDSGAFRSLCLFLLILASGFCPLSVSAQPLILNEESRLVTLPTGEKVVEWFGKPGRSYFIQVSDSNDPLRKWTWAQIIEPGNNQYISHQVIGTAAKGFFRLAYTDQTAADLDNADFDGDGLSNLAEITPNSTTGTQTNPLDPDTDHDGLTDKWERDHGLDPTDNGSINPDNGPSGDPDGDGLTNLDEQTQGTNPRRFTPPIQEFRQVENADGTVTYSWISFAEQGDWFHIEESQPNGGWKTIYGTTYGSAKLRYVLGRQCYTLTLNPATDYLP